MLSLGEVVLIVAAGSWAFGPKELPRMGRALGRLVGRASGWAYTARSRLFRFAEETELAKVQAELQATMHQLNAIRSELQGGINLLDPGPLTRRALGGVVPSTPADGLPRAAAVLRDGGAHTTERVDVATTRSSDGEPAAAAAGATAVTAQPPRPHLSVEQLLAGPAGARIQGSDGLKPAPFSLPDDPSIAAEWPFPVLPVSAVAAGLAPDRAGAAPTGAQVLADALQEERVAAQAAAFFRQHGVAAGSGTPVDERGAP